MNRVEFTFDGASHYALYQVSHLDGISEYYLELRDRTLISEFGLGISFKRNPDGSLLLNETGTTRKKNLLDTILLSIDRTAVK